MWSCGESTDVHKGLLAQLELSPAAQTSYASLMRSTHLRASSFSPLVWRLPLSEGAAPVEEPATAGDAPVAADAVTDATTPTAEALSSEERSFAVPESADAVVGLVTEEEDAAAAAAAAVAVGKYTGRGRAPRLPMRRC